MHDFLSIRFGNYVSFSCSPDVLFSVTIEFRFSYHLHKT